MEFLSKTLFFVLFGISVLLTLFYILSFFNLLIDPYKKVSEALIMQFGGCVLGVGLYLAYQQGYLPVNYVRGSVILLVAFITTIICVILGLMFFTGPINWQ